MKSSLEQERELSYKLLSQACMKREGYDFQATRCVHSGSVTAWCPTITPYDRQVDVAEALALGLDTTAIAGTRSGKTLPSPWAKRYFSSEEMLNFESFSPKMTQTSTFPHRKNSLLPPTVGSKCTDCS